MIESPWGPLAVADSHVHFFSPHFFSLLAAEKPGLTLDGMGQTLGWRMPGAPEALAADWVRELDRHGVERAVLIASLPGDEASVASAVAAHRGHFWGYFLLNPLAGDATPRLQAALDHLSLAGVCLFPAMHRFSMADERVAGVLDLIAATRPATIVFVHCGALSVGVRQRLGLPCCFDLRYSNPVDLHAVALRYPQLRFVVPHFGAGYLREALIVASLCPNIYLDTSSSNRWMAAEGLDLRHVFRRALDVAGAARLLFGTDSSFFPRGWQRGVFDEQATALYELGLGKDDAQAVFGGNLRGLLEA